MPDKSVAAAAAPLHRQKVPPAYLSTAPDAAATHRKAPILLLASHAPRSYNTEFAAFYRERGAVSIAMDKFEEFGRHIDEEVSRLKKINNFEDFGKRVDEELARVKSFVKEEVAPETEKRTAQFLREVSEKLSEAAGWIESRNSTRTEKDSQKPP